MTGIACPAGFSGQWSGAIAPGASQDVPVSFTPTQAKTYSATITVNCDSTFGTRTSACSGTGTQRVIVLAGDFAFGNIVVGYSPQRTFTITNTGNDALFVTGVTCPPGFSGDWSGTVAAGGSQSVTVTFVPTAAQTYQGSVTVQSNSTSGTNTLACSGTGLVANAAPVMTVEGPFVTIGDYIANGTGVLEKRWDYYVSNSSASGDINNMIEWKIDSGSDNGVLRIQCETFSSVPTINVFVTRTHCGFAGLLPPDPDPFTENNSVLITLITPADTLSGPGLAVATAVGGIEGNIPFPSVPVDVPAAVPTVDFTEDNGVASYNSTTGKYVLDMTVQNNMTISNAGYEDYVSEIKIDGIYSATAPTFTSRPAGFGNNNGGYTTIQLTDSVRMLWLMILGTNLNESRIQPESSRLFNINFTLPSGLPGSAIRYGNVNAQGNTFSHFYQPGPTPDTFIGPVGVEYPAPVVGLTVGAGQVRLGLVGLVVGREYRVMRSEDLSGWDEVDRFTVTEDPWPASGRVDREWSEAVVLPGRRFYKLEWDEP